VSCLFLDDGVFHLVPGQSPELLGIKSCANAFQLLEEYGASAYLCATSLRLRHLAADDLLIRAAVLDEAGQRRLLAGHDLVLAF
jgi:tRNA 2-thiouridine synthesizing protein C